MKKILCFLLIFLSLKSFAQYPNGKQTLGSDSNVIEPKGGFHGRVINWRYADTASANLQRISQYPGAQISVGNSIYVRDSTATAWILQGGGTTLSTFDTTTIYQNIQNVYNYFSDTSFTNQFFPRGDGVLLDTVIRITDSTLRFIYTDGTQVEDTFRIALTQENITNITNIINYIDSLRGNDTTFILSASNLQSGLKALYSTTDSLSGNDTLHLKFPHNNVSEDSVLTTDVDGDLKMKLVTGTGIDTTSLSSRINLKVDTIYRTPGKDSIQFTIGGRYHAIRDSIGAGGGSAADSLSYIYAEGFGARGDGEEYFDGAMTASSATLTSATAGFELADVGKCIRVGGAGASGAELLTTIAGFTNSTTVTLTATASTTVTGKRILFGTDNTTPIQNAINYALTGTNRARTVFFKSGMFCIAGAPITTGSNPNSQIYIPLTPYSPSLTQKSIRLLGATAPTFFIDFAANQRPSNSGTIFQSMRNDSSAALLGTESQSAIYGTFNWVYVYLENLTFRTKSLNGLTDIKPYMTAIDAHRMNMVNFLNIKVETESITGNSLQPDSLATGIYLPLNNNGGNVYLRNVSVGRFFTGIRANENTNGDNIWVYACNKGIQIDAGFHAIHFNRALVEWSVKQISLNGTGYFKFDNLDLEPYLAASGVYWFNTLYDFDDIGGTGKGELTYHRVEALGGVNNTGFTRSGTSSNYVVSTIGDNDLRITGPVTNATVGSVFFAGTGGKLQQSNSNFFYDSTNARLGLGYTAPAQKLHIRSADSLAVAGLAENVNAGVSSSAEWKTKNDGNRIANFGISSSVYNANSLIGANSGFLYSDATNGLGIVVVNGTFRIGTSTATERFRIAADGSVGVGLTGSAGAGSITMNGQLLNTGNNISNYQQRVGTFLTQSYALNNGFLSDNAYYNGSSWTRLSTGYATGFQFFNGQLMIHGVNTGTGNFTQAIQVKSDYTGAFALGANMTSSALGTFTGATFYHNASGRTFFGGSTSATAKIHIAAGTATASTAPLKFTAGVILTTPESGVMETNAGNELMYSTSTTAASRGFVSVQRYIAKTGTYTATADDGTIDCTSGTFTVTLPTAVGIQGRVYKIVNSGSGTITVGTTSSQTFTNINATPTTLTLGAVGAGAITEYDVQSNNANWIVVGKVKNE